MTVADISKKVPPVIFCAGKEFFLDRVVVTVRYAGPDFLFGRLRRIPKSFFEKRSLAPRIPIEGFDIRGSDGSDKLGHYAGCRSVNKHVKVIKHQGQSQHDNAITPGINGKNGIEYQTVLYRKKTNTISKCMLKDMFKSILIVFSPVTSHDKQF